MVWPFTVAHLGHPDTPSLNMRTETAGIFAIGSCGATWQAVVFSASRAHGDLDALQSPKMEGSEKTASGDQRLLWPYLSTGTSGRGVTMRSSASRPASS